MIPASFVAQFNQTEAFIHIRNNVDSITESKRCEYIHDVTINGVTQEVWSSDLVEFASTL